MDLCICGDTASKLLGKLSRNELLNLDLVDASDVVFSNLDWKESRDLAQSIWGESQIAADILVRDPLKRARGSGATYHVWSSEIPPGSLARYSENIVVALPWFELIRRAKELDIRKISKDLMLLTAIYDPSEGSGDDLPACEPLIARDALEQYVDSAKGARGISKVREALSWSPPNARSPREIDLTLAFSSPRRLGGCELPVPELNHQVDLGSDAAKMLDKKVVFTDLFWKRRMKDKCDCGAEYLGEKDHPSIGPELTRVNALELEGIELHLITNDQMKDAKQLLMSAKRIARAIGYTPFGSRWPSEGELQSHIDKILAI